MQKCSAPLTQTLKLTRVSKLRQLPAFAAAAHRPLALACPHGGGQVMHLPASRVHRAHLSTTAARGTKNQIYSPIRNHDSFHTHVSLSSSARTPLLTLWTASWCPTCRTIEPLLRSIIESGVGEQEGGVGFAPVEFDSPDLMTGSASGQDNLALTYMITSVPTLLSFDAGEAQMQTKLVDARKMADRGFLEEWVRTEARRHGGRGGGGGGGPGSLFGGLFGSSSK